MSYKCQDKYLMLRKLYGLENGIWQVDFESDTGNALRQICARLSSTVEDEGTEQLEDS